MNRYFIEQFEPQVFKSYDTTDILKKMQRNLVTRKLGIASAKLCGFDAGNNLEATLAVPRSTIYLTDFDQWREDLEWGEDMMDPLSYCLDALNPCIGVYDAGKLVPATSGITPEFRHTSSNDVQDALHGVFLF